MARLLRLLRFVGPYVATSLEDLGTAKERLDVSGLGPCVCPPRFSDDLKSYASNEAFTMPTDAFTVEMWLKTSGRDEAIVSYAAPGEGDGSNFVLFNNNKGNLVMFINGWDWETGVHVGDGNWHHLAVTYDAGGESNKPELQVYMDGSYVKGNMMGGAFIGAGYLPSTAGSLYLGQEQDNTAEEGVKLDAAKAFGGFLGGEFRVWKVVRTHVDILASMRQSVEGQPNLLHLYRFGPDVTTSLEDLGLAKENLVVSGLWPCDTDEQEGNLGLNTAGGGSSVAADGDTLKVVGGGLVAGAVVVALVGYSVRARWQGGGSGMLAAGMLSGPVAYSKQQGDGPEPSQLEGGGREMAAPQQHNEDGPPTKWTANPMMV